MNGLDNFDIGLSNVFPPEGSPIAAGSYTLCGAYNGPASVSNKVKVPCVPLPTLPYRYLIIRSRDEKAERLCIAEVAVYGKIGVLRTYCCHAMILYSFIYT